MFLKIYRFELENNWKNKVLINVQTSILMSQDCH